MAICGFNDAWAKLFYGTVGQWLSTFIILVNAVMVMALIWVDYQCSEEEDANGERLCLDGWAYGIQNLNGDTDHNHNAARFAFFLITSTFVGYLVLLLFRAASIFFVWNRTLNKDELKKSKEIRVFKAVIFTVIFLMQVVAMGIYFDTFVDEGYKWDVGARILISVVILSIVPWVRMVAKAIDAYRDQYWERSGSGHWIQVGGGYKPVNSGHRGGRAEFEVLGSISNVASKV